MTEPPRKPFAPACERNRDPILTLLRSWFDDRQQVLEIGSGTGQHAVHFAAAMPQLQWQTSDRAEYLSGIRSWLDEAALPNTPAPILLDVGSSWPSTRYDAVFSANTLHIMSWPEVQQLFSKLDGVLGQDAKLAIYGPFNYGGSYGSSSNAEFDRWLHSQAPHQAIRDFEAVDALANSIGLKLLDDHEMPANNRCLLWQRRA